MSDSDLSSLSSVESIETDEDLLATPAKAGTLDAYLKNGARGASAASPPTKKKRPASPPHEYVLADNPDIAFIVMFRSRFSGAFPKSLSHYGPQDIEKGIVGPLPDEHVERLLCALIGLVLNRKKDVEYDSIYAFLARGHFQRALEESVQMHNSQWPVAWGGKNPLHGGGNFNTMSPEQRLTLLKTLMLWSLNSSEAVQAILKESYKQQRHEDDLNQPLSVQPWGRDGDKRRYWLIEGQDDTHFRLYRESNPALKHNTWRSVAGTIDELKAVAEKLGDEGSQAARRLCDGIRVAIPRFELSEDKRKRRDYRNARKAQFTRPEPGFSLYEGRTRGKRIKYTYSDDEEGGSDAMSTRRSNRQSGISTPAELVGPTFTASGRQVKSRVGGVYGESRLSAGHNHEVEAEAGTDSADAVHDTEEAAKTRTRLRGAAQLPRIQGGRKHIEGYNALDEMEDESDASMSGGEWDGGDDDEDVDDNIIDDEEDEDADMSESGESANEPVDGLASRPSLVVSLRFPKKSAAAGSRVDSEPKDTAMANGFTNPSREAAPTVNGDKPITNGGLQPTSDYKPSNLHHMSSADGHPVQPVIPQGILSG